MRKNHRRHISTGGHHTDAPRNRDAKGIIRWLVAYNDGLQMNGGKALDFSLTRRRRWISRDRTVGNHHLVEARGNKLCAFVGENSWLDERRSVFTKEALLLTLSLCEYREFLRRYKELTPELEWWTD